jgi:hypothetical protein
MGKNVLWGLGAGAAALVIAVTAIIGGVLRPKKLSAAIVTETNPMFYTDGTINQTLVQQLAALCAATPRTNINVGAAVNTPTSDAGAIRTANGGAVPNVKLFQSLGTDEATGTGSNPNRFSNLGWHLMYVTNVNGQYILTFWADKEYRTSRFNGTDYSMTDRLVKIDYNQPSPNLDTAAGAPGANNAAFPALNVASNPGSQARNQIMNDFCTFLSTNFSSVAPYIATPREVGWQTAQPQTASEQSGVDSLTGARLDDLIWLPSCYEIGDGTNSSVSPTDNLWNATNTERAYTYKYYTLIAFRSSSSYTTYSSACIVSYSGAFGNSNVNNNLGFRPALHIMLPAIPKESSIAAGFAPGSTTGSGAGVTLASADFRYRTQILLCGRARGNNFRR